MLLKSTIYLYVQKILFSLPIVNPRGPEVLSNILIVPSGAFFWSEISNIIPRISQSQFSNIGAGASMLSALPPLGLFWPSFFTSLLSLQILIAFYVPFSWCSCHLLLLYPSSCQLLWCLFIDCYKILVLLFCTIFSWNFLFFMLSGGKSSIDDLEGWGQPVYSFMIFLPYISRSILWWECWEKISSFPVCWLYILLFFFRLFLDLACDAELLYFK